MKSYSPITFKRLVVLSNPKSSNAHKATKAIAALQAAYPGKVVTGQTSIDEQTTCEFLKTHLREGDILIPAGGDGTISTAVDCLLHPDMPAKLRRTRVLPLGAGRMNDIAHMLNGRYHGNPLYVLQHGRELPVYPLDVVFTPLSGKGRPHRQLAMYSLGIGYSATISRLFNDPDFRSKQKKRPLPAREVELFKVSYDAIKDAPYFEITYAGKRHSVFDISVVNGHIVAGYYRLPVQFSSREFMFDFLDTKGLLPTVKTIAELMTNRYKGGELATSADFILHEAVPAHIGGEPFTPPAPSKVSIKLHAEPVIMLATSPKA